MTRRIVKYVAVNEKGQRIGEGHPNSKISDATVDLIRDLREEDCLTYDAIAKQLNICRQLVAKICRYERRAQTPDRWKKVITYEQ